MKTFSFQRREFYLTVKPQENELCVQVVSNGEHWYTLSYYDDNFTKLGWFDKTRHFGLRGWSENQDIASFLIKQEFFKLEFCGQIPGVTNYATESADVIVSLSEKAKDFAVVLE